MYISIKIKNEQYDFSEHINFDSKVYTQSKYQIIPSLKIVEKPSINYKKKPKQNPKNKKENQNRDKIDT